jgi:hypothetical protein
VSFDRYEAEDAARHWAVQIGDPTASNRSKARVAAAPLGRLDFDVHVDGNGQCLLRVRWQDLGFPTAPVLSVDGRIVAAGDTTDDRDGWRVTRWRAPLGAGDHRISVAGGAHALDVDYLQIDAAGSTGSGQ